MILFSLSIIILFTQTQSFSTILNIAEIIEGEGNNNYTLKISTKDIYSMKLSHKGRGQISLWQLQPQNMTEIQVYPIEWSTFATVLENKFSLEKSDDDFIVEILSDSSYTLVVLREQVQFIKPNVTILGMLLEEETQKYQISVKKDDYLEIIMNNCIGSSEIITKYDGSTKFINDDTIMIEVKAAHPTLLKSQENAVIFHLVAYTSTQPLIPQQRYRYQFVVGYSNIYFEVEPLQYNGNPGILTYIVHATNDMASLQAYSRCQMSGDQYLEYQEQNNDYYHDTTSYTIDSKQNANKNLIILSVQNPNLQTLFVTIICQIKEIDNGFPLQFFYDTKVIQFQKDSQFLEEHQNEIIIAVSIFLFVFILLIFTLYCYKKRNSSQVCENAKQSEENEQVIQKNEV